MQISKQEKIEKFLGELTNLFNLQYQINKETDMCNHSYVVRNLLPAYEDSKQIVRQSLDELLDINSEP